MRTGLSILNSGTLPREGEAEVATSNSPRPPLRTWVNLLFFLSLPPSFLHSLVLDINSLVLVSFFLLFLLWSHIVPSRMKKKRKKNTLLMCGLKSLIFRPIHYSHVRRLCCMLKVLIFWSKKISVLRLGFLHCTASMFLCGDLGAGLP